MLVTKKNFDAFLRSVAGEKVLGFDAETTCLNWWRSPWHNVVTPRVFSAQFSTEKEDFYLDFNHSDDKLTDAHFAKLQAELIGNPELLWFIANAKFDLHHGANHGLDFKGRVHCTKAQARVVNNLEPSLSLDHLSETYLSRPKLEMIPYLHEHGHVTKVKKFGHNDKYEEILHFDRAPLQMLVEYGERDTRNCFDLGVYQVRKVLEIDSDIMSKIPAASFGEMRLKRVMENEQALTKVFFKMERTGVLIDRAYTEEAYEHEVSEYKRIEIELNKLSTAAIGKSLDWLSAKQLKPLFDKLGESYSYTQKGNASFDKDALERSDSEVAKLILQYRYHNKRAHTYFENFLWLMDTDNVLHADAQQSGTETGRVSYWTPNLQNVPKRGDKDEKNYKVRRCFIPKPGFFFADIDYTGAEYYMALDYAKETEMIGLIKDGLDPHLALGKDLGLERDPAKTMQFRIIYGGGFSAVGYALGAKSEAEANALGREKKTAYFARLPRVADFLKNVSAVAGARGYLFTWFGRLLKYGRDTAYKAPNGLIQGGVGDMTKVAMVRIDNVLTERKSRMVLQVHDAILGEIAYGEEHLIPIMQRTMEAVYPARLLPMKTDAGFSATDWSTLEDEIPTPRKNVSISRAKKASRNPSNVVGQSQ